MLNSMKVGAERIQKIVASLRNFSRMDEAEKKVVNVHEGIDSTLMIPLQKLGLALSSKFPFLTKTFCVPLICKVKLQEMCQFPDRQRIMQILGGVR